MHKWLLFEMAKNPQSEDRKAIPAAKGIGDGTAELGSSGNQGGVGMGHLTGNQALPPVMDLFVLWGAPVLWLLEHHRASLPTACRAFGIKKRLEPHSKSSIPGRPRASERSPSRSFFTFNCFWIGSPAEKGLGADSVPSVSVALVLTKCQAEATFGTDLVGHFRPQCDENGDYMPKQCNFTTGFCWCCYKNGTKIKDTDTREKLDCPGRSSGRGWRGRSSVHGLLGSREES